MIKKNVIMLLVVAIVALVVIGVFYLFLVKKMPVSQAPGENQGAQSQEVSPLPATGNVDDALNSFLKELTDEEALLRDVEGDTILVSDDGQEISVFGQSINESEF